MSGNETKTDIGNPRDVQGILALVVIIAVFVIATVAIVKGADVTAVLNSFLPLASMVAGFYFGVKSQQ